MTASERAARLRRSAEHCRALARGAVPLSVAREIELFADELEHEAETLERPERRVFGRAAPRRKTPSLV